MRRFNFLPDTILEHRHTLKLKSQLFLSAIVIATFTFLGAAFIVFHALMINAQIEIQNNALKSAQHAYAQLRAIQSQIDILNIEQLKFSALSNQIPPEAVISLLASKMPENIAIGTLGWRIPELVEVQFNQPEADKKTNKFKKNKQRNPQIAELGIGGLAQSDGDVADFITGLSSHQLFSQVNLIQSKEVVVNGKTLYEFFIDAKIPTNRDFLITSATE